jgi:hypothetical protein
MYNNLQESEIIRNLNSEVKRYNIINYLVEKYKLVNYLEIGVFQGENIRLIKATHKDGVDPGHEGYVVPEVNYPMTSDDFFELIKGHDDIKYDIIFIDGLHHSDQVEKDIQNSLNHLVEGGFIIMHDCNPSSYETQLIPRQTIAWTGDVWKAFVKFKFNHPNFKSCVIDTDFGVGVIQNIADHRGPFMPLIEQSITEWDYFKDNKKQLLNLVTWNEFKTIF